MRTSQITQKLIEENYGRIILPADEQCLQYTINIYLQTRVNGKDHDGFRGGFVMLEASRQSEVTLHAFVTSKQHLSGCWELDKRQ